MAIKGLSSEVTGVTLLNTIRSTIIANEGLDYADRVPEATQENLQDIGKAILEYAPAKNQFLDTLINRIGLVVIRNRLYKNKLSFFKKGTLDFGDSIEEIFVDLAKAIHYEPAPPEDNLGDVWEQFKPKVVAAFHRVNREDTYPVTINEAMLKRAFTGWANFDSFVSGIFNSLYNADEYDEFVIFKRLLGECAQNNYRVHVDPVIDRATAEEFSIQMRAQGLNLEYMSRKYNELGVATHCSLADQILILRSDIVPNLDVRVLANAFNMNLAQPLSGRIVVVDDFSEGNDDIVAMIVDREWSMIYDTLYDAESIYNPRHKYWNYFLHHHQIISCSPFASVIVFTTATVTDAIVSVTVSPSTVSVAKGSTQTFEADVEYTGDIDTSVTFSISGQADSGTTIDATSGLLTVSSEETATTITVTATSVADSTKYGTATVTVTD